MIEINGEKKMNQKSLNETEVLQSRALRKITFKKLHNTAHPIYCKLHMRKFNDMI